MLTNTGLIVGEARLSSGAANLVRNSGVIEGEVLLGNAEDKYDGRGGEAGRVIGFEGADTLIGGGGEDILVGGLGADRMKGGADADVFVYFALADSRGKAIDVIRGWDAADAIDLSFVDANPGKAGTQHLTFGGLIAAGDPVGNDMVQYYRKGGDTYVVADVNGDGTADFLVRIVGVVTLDEPDFVLG
jgi:Ca2+-binding RTX toxin-like protein